MLLINEFQEIFWSLRGEVLDDTQFKWPKWSLVFDFAAAEAGAVSFEELTQVGGEIDEHHVSSNVAAQSADAHPGRDGGVFEFS